MLFKSYALATLVASALAQPLGHIHHHHNEERDVAYVTQTNVVTVGAGGQPTSTPAAQTTEATSPAAESSSSAAETTEASSPVVSSSSASSSPESSSSDVPSSSSSSGEASSASSGSSSTESSSDISGGNGITYSPYSSGGCKSSNQIASEVKRLSSYDIVRVYGTDCNQVGAVLAALGDSQKLFAGVYDVNNIQSEVDTIASAVKSNGGWDKIHTVSIGNELVNDGQAKPSQVKQYIQQGKSALQSAGYNGPVVSVDTFIAVIENTDLCDYSDYVAVNAHAFFDGGVAASGSGQWLLDQIQRVASACNNNKKVYITETGWPSKGETNGKAVPSQSNQKSAIDSIVNTCGNDAILFTAYNDMWKQPGAFDSEQYWGILSSN